MKRIKKIFWLFLLLLNIFSLTFDGALAWGESILEWEVIDVASDITTNTFSRLGLDENEINYYSHDFNVSRRKKQQPQVQLTFNPANPVPGQKVTAVATPMNFMNDEKSLYFTWYLKSKENGDNDIEDYKVRAARIIANNDFEYQNEAYDEDSDSDGYRAQMGGGDQRGKNDHCYIHDVETGNEYELTNADGSPSCSHLFPEAPGHNTGDNNFGSDEEKYWRTNPNDPDTADLGQNDEATISGLGVNSFTWVYSAGDKVGVAVEGISLESTQYSDSSYKIMWALPKNRCSEINDHAKTAVPQAVNGFTINMRASDINECLEENLIDPAEGGGTKEKMEIELSYSPEFPMNDPGSPGEDSDRVTINSTVVNAQNNGFLNYSWQVYKSDEPNPDSWGSPLTKAQLKNSTQTEGMGADKLSFNLNFSDTDPFYLKIKLTVKENVSNSVVREGYNFVVIPISSASEKIRIYKSTVSSNSSGNPTIGISNDELCSSGIDKAVCPVIKDQIIGLGVPDNFTDYSWMINGQTYNYSVCFYEGCNDTNLAKQSNTAFFPILDEPGSQYVVTLNATNITSGKKVNLERHFQVVEPEVKIVSADESVLKPVLLGQYIDYDGQTHNDWSRNNFQAVAGQNIALAADFTDFVPEGANYGWIVDGIGINQNNADAFGYEINSNNELIIPSKDLGETTSVGISAFYYPDNLTKKALNAYWNVNYGGFYETEVGDTIDILAVDSLPGSEVTSKNAKQNKILASLFSSTPSYMAFLFRIVLTGSLLLFFSAFILSFFPEIKKEQI